MRADGHVIWAQRRASGACFSELLNLPPVTALTDLGLGRVIAFASSRLSVECRPSAAPTRRLPAVSRAAARHPRSQLDASRTLEQKDCCPEGDPPFAQLAIASPATGVAEPRHCVRPRTTEAKPTQAAPQQVDAAGSRARRSRPLDTAESSRVRLVELPRQAPRPARRSSCSRRNVPYSGSSKRNPPNVIEPSKTGDSGFALVAPSP